MHVAHYVANSDPALNCTSRVIQSTTHSYTVYDFSYFRFVWTILVRFDFALQASLAKGTLHINVIIIIIRDKLTHSR